MNIDTIVLMENSERAMQGTVSVAEIDPAQLNDTKAFTYMVWLKSHHE